MNAPLFEAASEPADRGDRRQHGCSPLCPPDMPLSPRDTSSFYLRGWPCEHELVVLQGTGEAASFPITSAGAHLAFLPLQGWR